MEEKKLNTAALEIVYQKTQIDYLFSDNEKIMINATEMAKLFGKRIDVFLKTEPTKAFINVLEFPPVGGNSAPLSREELIVTKGQKGTYFHRILALKFAAWLDPYFEVWVYTEIENILFGKAKLVSKKITDEENKKLQIAILIDKVKKIGNEDVNQLLNELD